MQVPDAVVPSDNATSSPAVLRVPRVGAVERVGVRIALSAIVVAAVALWGLVASSVSAPWIYVDELIYSDLAKSIASGGAPAVRGVTTYGYGIGYPVLIAPAWVVVHDLGNAYAVARLINALVMSLAAVPAYFLARRFVSTGNALVVAALTVAVPSMVYVTTIMTEVAFYPLFLLALLSMQRALERPSWGRQGAALAAIALASATKVLAIGLLPAWVLAAMLQAREEPGAARRVRAGLGSTGVALSAVGLGLALLALVRGSSPIDLFGAYGGALRDIRFGALPLAFAQQVDALLLYCAVIPVVATAAIVIGAFRRDAPARSRALAALVLPTVSITLAGVALFAVYASRIDYQSTGVPSAFSVYERNLFGLAPLMFIGLAAWSSERTARKIAWGVAVAALALLTLYPWAEISMEAANPQNLASFPWVLLPLSPTGLRIAVVIMALAAVVAWLRARTSSRRPLAAVAGWLAFVTLLSVAIFHGAAAQADRDGVGSNPSWVDDAVGAGAHVDVVWLEPAGRFASPRSRQRVVWANEFFNRSVSSVDTLGARLPFGLPDRPVARRSDGVLVDERGKPIHAAYVLATCAVSIDAPIVAVDRKTRVALRRTAGVVRLGGAVGCTSR